MRYLLRVGAKIEFIGNFEKIFVINLNISQFNLLNEWSLQLFHQVRRVLGILYSW